jgi:hypothetical protein
MMKRDLATFQPLVPTTSYAGCPPPCHVVMLKSALDPLWFCASVDTSASSVWDYWIAAEHWWSSSRGIMRIGVVRCNHASISGGGAYFC